MTANRVHDKSIFQKGSLWPVEISYDENGNREEQPRTTYVMLTNSLKKTKNVCVYVCVHGTTLVVGMVENRPQQPQDALPHERNATLFMSSTVMHPSEMNLKRWF